MRHTYRKSAATMILAASLLLAALPAAAQFQVIPASCIDQGGASKAPSLNCVIETGVSVARIFFGLSGSFALLMFVIGGFYYITSAGSEEKVKKGKEYIRNAVIGLVIILTGAYGIEYGMSALQGGSCSGTQYTDAAGTSQCCEGGVVTEVKTGTGAGSQKCTKGTGEKVCAEVMPGYTCMDITLRADKGAACVRNLCLGADKDKDEVRCCPAE